MHFQIYYFLSSSQDRVGIYPYFIEEETEAQRIKVPSYSIQLSAKGCGAVSFKCRHMSHHAFYASACVTHPQRDVYSSVPLC